MYIEKKNYVKKYAYYDSVCVSFEKKWSDPGNALKNHFFKDLSGYGDATLNRIHFA